MACEARDCYQDRTLAENSLVRNSKDPKKSSRKLNLWPLAMACFFGLNA